jgi:hypothetical protein
MPGKMHAEPGVIFRVGASQSGDQARRSRHDLHGRSGHGAPGILGPAYLEGTYAEIYPDKSEDPKGMQKFFERFDLTS